MGCGVSSSNSRYAPDEKPGQNGKSPRLAGIAAALDTGDDKEDAKTVEPAKEEPADPVTQEKLAIVKEVYIFRHLSPVQLRMVVDALKPNKYKRGINVVTQHEVGDTFFIVASGELQVLINDEKIRTLGRHAYFGERALLFDEPRTATVQVASDAVEAWSVDKGTFMSIVRGNMQSQLMWRIRLQDTSVAMDDLITMRQIGEGAAGCVDLVQHKKTKTRYALKKVKKENGNLPEDVKREIDLLKMNDHPFVMHLVKTFETQEEAFMLVELITGGELHAAIRTIPTVLSASQAMFYIGSLALGLEALHGRKIIYRDLKPENVMLDHQGYLKIIDFGIAKKLEADKPRTFTMLGTPHYMAPEVMKGRGYTFSVDHWALGVILFELVCGSLPFGNDLDEAQEVFLEVLHNRIEYPPWYKDRRGIELMKGLMTHDPKKRLGSGPTGFQEIKFCSWFMAAKSPNGNHVFDQLMGRELDAPVIPMGETYSAESPK